MARELYEGLSVVREQLRLAQTFIGRVQNTAQRAALMEAHQQAEVPLTQAIHAGHRFVYDELRERLDVARTRAEALLAQLANR
jgi:hypothetical protein